LGMLAEVTGALEGKDLTVVVVGLKVVVVVTISTNFLVVVGC
jgi:hypothetical protein